MTVKDSYPLPRVDESLDFLSRGKFLSTLDLARGCWQVPMAQEAKPKTAFITHCGLFQFKVLPFGLCNAPATFQQLMNNVLAGLIYKLCAVYLDDIVVASPTFEQHLIDLEEAPHAELTKKNVQFVWNEKCQEAMDFLKHSVTSAPVLRFPDFTRPFFIHTDACDAGLGAAPMQNGEDGREVAFASRALHKAEKPYSSSHLGLGAFPTLF